MAVPVLRADEETFVAPPRPEDGVFDEARLFVRSPERLAKIVEALSLLEEAHGFHLYYAIYDSLFDTTVAERAQRLQDAWVGDAAGMVLVLEVDSRAFQVGRSRPRETEIEPGMKMQLKGATELSPVELAGLVRGLEGRLRDVPDREEVAEVLGIGFAEGVSALFDEHDAIPEAATRSRMIALAVGLIAATGLIALLVVAGLKRAEARAQERYVFPKVSVGIRLGAPYGGGKVSSRTFRHPGPES